ncbi:MAG: hypothetical protein ACUVRI_05555 [Armatimonadota bacterium]
MIRSRLAVRIALALMGIALLSAFVAVVSFMRDLSVAQVPQRPPRFAIERQKVPGPVRTLQCSPNGGAFSIVTGDGGLGVYTSRGTLKCWVILPDVTSALPTDDAGYLAAYSERDPSRPVIFFFNYFGKLEWKLQVKGAVWCADVFGDSCGATFVVGTSAGYIYVVELGSDRKRFHRFRVPGAVTSVVINPDSQSIVFATWQRSSIGRYTFGGRRVWLMDASPELIYRVSLTRSPDTVVAYGRPLRSGVGLRVMVIRDKTVLWESDISSQYQAVSDVVFSGNGDYFCLACCSTINHKGKTVKEQRAVLMDTSGRTLVDKGSLFFSAVPLAVTEDGGVLLCGNGRGLFSMNCVGKLEKIGDLPSRIARVAVSKNSRLLLVECEGGILLRLTWIRL